MKQLSIITLSLAVIFALLSQGESFAIRTDGQYQTPVTNMTQEKEMDTNISNLVKTITIPPADMRNIIWTVNTHIKKYYELLDTDMKLTMGPTGNMFPGGKLCSTETGTIAVWYKLPVNTENKITKLSLLLDKIPGLAATADIRFYAQFALLNKDSLKYVKKDDQHHLTAIQRHDLPIGSTVYDNVNSETDIPVLAIIVQNGMCLEDIQFNHF